MAGEDYFQVCSRLNKHHIKTDTSLLLFLRVQGAFKSGNRKRPFHNLEATCFGVDVILLTSAR